MKRKRRTGHVLKEFIFVAVHGGGSHDRRARECSPHTFFTFGFGPVERRRGGFRRVQVGDVEQA